MSVFVTLMTGLIISISSGSGGTIDNPIPRFSDGGQVKLASFDLPNGEGLVLFNPSDSYHDDPGGTFNFRKIETTTNAVPYHGSIMGATNLILIPDDPTHYRTSSLYPFTSHVLLGGEMLVIYKNSAALNKPSAAKIAAVKNIIHQTSALGQIQSNPRLKHFIKILADSGSPANAPQGEDWDMGWTLRNWVQTAGGAPRKGWFNSLCPRGSGGLDNWHYNRLLYLALNFIENPTNENWEFGLRQAIAHATLGREWTGLRKGMAKYEKGDVFLGDQQPGDWAKQWSPGLVVWALLSDNYILNKAIATTKQMHMNVNPILVWQGYWGARLAARYLEELLIYYLISGDPVLLGKAQTMITHIENLIGPQGWWPNLGNGGAAEESPWMQAQLVTAIYRWYERIPSLEAATGFTRTELDNVGAAIMQDGSELRNGKRALRYRMGTTIVPAPSMHLTSFAVPMLRYMSAHNPQYKPLRNEVTNFVMDWAGSQFSDIPTGSPPPLPTIGYRFPPQGFGWSKSMLFYLEALR